MRTIKFKFVGESEWRWIKNIPDKIEIELDNIKKYDFSAVPTDKELLDREKEEQRKRKHENHIRANSRRKKKYGFIPITPPLNVPFDWHHIDMVHVVAVPHEIHLHAFHSEPTIKIEGILG